MISKCKLCGEPMPNGEEMFNYHGYSCPCPKPPLETTPAKRTILVFEGEEHELFPPDITSAPRLCIIKDCSNPTEKGQFACKLHLGDVKNL